MAQESFYIFFNPQEIWKHHQTLYFRIELFESYLPHLYQTILMKILHRYLYESNDHIWPLYLEYFEAESLF